MASALDYVLSYTIPEQNTEKFRYFAGMKAPISKKLLAILSDKAGSKELVHTAIVKDKSQSSSIKIGNKEYELHRVASYIKH